MKRTSKAHSRNRGVGGQSSRRVFAIYAAALIIVMAVVIGYASRASGTAQASGVGLTPGQSGKPLSWCGWGSRAACPAVDPGWIYISSDLQGDIARVIAGSPDFKRMQQRYDGVSLDLPALVHPYHPADPNAGSDYFVDDHWVATVRNSAGAESGIFDFVYDRANHRIRFSSYSVLLPSNPHYGHAFPFVSADAAAAQLGAQRHLSVMAGASSELIFFPVAQDWQGPQASHHWTDGGGSPMDPMWLMVGNDGLQYFVGGNLHVHTPKDLPIA